MKIVVDCNIIISAGLTDGVCRQLIFEAFERHEIIITDDILTEYKTVAARNKFTKIKSFLFELIAIIESYATKIVDQTVYEVDLPDPKDLIYIYAAINSQAKYLVTGNIKDFPNLTYKCVEVLLPKNFLSKNNIYLDDIFSGSAVTFDDVLN